MRRPTRSCPALAAALLERLAVTKIRRSEASVLAEMLAEDLQDWPRGGWLAIDRLRMGRHVRVVGGVRSNLSRALACSDNHWCSQASRVAPGSRESVCVVRAVAVDRYALSHAKTRCAASASADLEPQSDAFRVTSTGWPVLVGLAQCSERCQLPRSQRAPMRQLRRVAEGVAPESSGSNECTLRLVILASLPIVELRGERLRY